MKNPILRNALSDDVKEAIATIAKKHGLDGRFVSGRYDEATFTMKVEFVDQAKKANQANDLAPLLGLPDDVVGSSFIHQGLRYTVSGLKPRNPKNCVILACDNGKQYKTSVKAYKLMSMKGA